MSASRTDAFAPTLTNACDVTRSISGSPRSWRWARPASPASGSPLPGRTGDSGGHRTPRAGESAVNNAEPQPACPPAAARHRL